MNASYSHISVVYVEKLMPIVFSATIEENHRDDPGKRDRNAGSRPFANREEENHHQRDYSGLFSSHFLALLTLSRFLLRLCVIVLVGL